MSGPADRPRPLRPHEADALAAARLRAARSHPYLAAALFAMEPRALDGLGTFAVDARWRLYVDPACLHEWGVAGVAAVLLHEVGHLVRDHAGRGEALGGDARRWNVAGDLAINDDLQAEGVVLPVAGLFPASFGFPAGLLEEEYHARLGTDGGDADASGGGRSGSGRTRPGQGDGQGAGRGDGRGEVHDAGRDAIPGWDDGRGAGWGEASTPDTAGCDCGSGADGRPRPWEDPADGGLDARAATAVRAAAANEVRAARSRGTVPAGWARWAGDGGPTRPDWRALLRAAVRRPRTWRSGNVDHTWARPDRRADAHPGIELPGRQRPVVEVAVVVDTSGSMGDEALAACMAEVEAVRRQCGLRALWLVPCDARPGTPQRVTSARPVELVGGGGTDLRPAIELAARLRPRPDVVVVLTDGWTPWPASAPRGVSLVVATTDRPCPVPGSVTVVVDTATA